MSTDLASWPTRTLERLARVHDADLRWARTLVLNADDETAETADQTIRRILAQRGPYTRELGYRASARDPNFWGFAD
jgi:hypothetical protein